MPCIFLLFVMIMVVEVREVMNFDDQTFLLEVEEVPFIFLPIHHYHGSDDGNVDDHGDGGEF